MDDETEVGEPWVCPQCGEALPEAMRGAECRGPGSHVFVVGGRRSAPPSATPPSDALERYAEQLAVRARFAMRVAGTVLLLLALFVACMLAAKWLGARAVVP